MKNVKKLSTVLLFGCSCFIAGCVGISTKEKQIQLLQYYHLDRKKLRNEISKILDEMGGHRVKGDVERFYKQTLSLTNTYHQGSKQPEYSNSFTIVKFTGFEHLRKRSSDYSLPWGVLKQCNTKKIIASGLSLAPLGGGKYIANIFATTKSTDLIEYDLRKMSNICFQAHTSSMVFGTIESNLIKVGSGQNGKVTH